MPASLSTQMFNSSDSRLRSLLSGILLAFAVLNGATANAASIVFNNIPAAPQYYHNYGNWTGTLGNQYAITATSFTPSGSGPLDSLDAGVTYGLGANSITLRLSPDAAGLPGASIWQTTVPPAAAFGQLLSLTGIGGPLLNMGQQYWLEAVAPVSPVTVQSWWTNNQGDAGPIVATGNYVASATALFATGRRAHRARAGGVGSLIVGRCRRDGILANATELSCTNAKSKPAFTRRDLPAVRKAPITALRKLLNWPEAR